MKGINTIIVSLILPLIISCGSNSKSNPDADLDSTATKETAQNYFNKVQTENKQMVRIAKLVIDSTQLAQYNALLMEEIEASIRIEPGVLALYPVGEKNRPTRITILEIYASEEAYNKHIQAPHFLKYKNATKGMVKSLELTEVIPLIPEMKFK